MPLLLQHLLDDSGLGLELCAGRAGLSERGPVRWVHSSEIPDPTPWLEGGEVLLTTGLGIKDSPALQRRLIAGLADRGCAGVGFGVGVVLEEVPRALVAAANDHRMPLFTVPYEVPFIAVTKRISRFIFDEHYATLRSAVDLHRRVLAGVLAGTGVRGVVETVAGQMPDFGLVLFDYYGTVLAQQGGPAVDAGPLWDALARAGHRRDRYGVTFEGHAVEASVVRLAGEVEAILAVVGDRELHEHESLLLEQGLTGVSLEAARGLSARVLHRARADDLLQEVFEGRIAEPVLARRLAAFGLDPRAPYRAIGVARPEAVSERALCALVEETVAGTHGAGRDAVVGRYDGLVYAVAQPPAGDDAERVAAAAKARGWAGVAVGRSRTRRAPADLHTALREARAAARRGATDGRPVLDVEDLGLTGLLAGIDDDPGTGAFVARILGPVLRHDEVEGAQLADTLRSYLRHGCRPGPAAAELCIHRHTLAYRLGRIRVLTGRDPRDGANLLEFALALELQPEGSASASRSR
jgi:purine catabolism regulator